ncbi:MAG TPA: hypothetical protein VEK57_12300 [Thermoanaerobaculia bacterium]|nr:hypothetical protein [Thermoanaerobaculia bacterium]
MDWVRAENIGVCVEGRELDGDRVPAGLDEEHVVAKVGVLPHSLQHAPLAERDAEVGRDAGAEQALRGGDGLAVILVVEEEAGDRGTPETCERGK